MKKESKPKPMTWKWIKDQIENSGIRDEDEIRFIDIPGFNENLRIVPIPIFLKKRPVWEITQ